MFIRRSSTSRYYSSSYSTNSSASGLPMGVYVGVGCAIFAVVLSFVILSACCLKKRPQTIQVNTLPGSLRGGIASPSPLRSVGRETAQSRPPGYHEPTLPPPTYGNHHRDKVYQVV